MHPCGLLSWSFWRTWHLFFTTVAWDGIVAVHVLCMWNSNGSTSSFAMHTKHQTYCPPISSKMSPFLFVKQFHLFFRNSIDKLTVFEHQNTWLLPCLKGSCCLLKFNAGIRRDVIRHFDWFIDNRKGRWLGVGGAYRWRVQVVCHAIQLS